MKEKTIRLIIEQKINEWVNSIGNINLRKEVKKNCIVTGGAIASMLLNEDVNDYDVYFTNRETAKKVVEYYVSDFEDRTKDKYNIAVVDNFIDRIKIVIDNGVVALDDEYESLEEDGPSLRDIIDKYRKNEKINNGIKNANNKTYIPVYISSNAITLSGGIQLIVRFFGSPEDIHKNYDFIHCTNYWVGSTGELVLNPEAVKSLLIKELVYVGSKYPIASLIRTRKFIKRGFTCNAGQFLKMCWQVNDLNLNDLDVLEDQLMGVDAAYFIVLINELRNWKSKGTEIDYNFVCKLIDEIF